MVSFELTDEQLMLEQTAHEFAEKEIRPIAQEYDEKEEMPYDVFKKMHQIGLTKLNIPQEYGGESDGSLLNSVIVAEELAWGCAGIAVGMGGPGFAGYPLLTIGTEEQKRRFLKFLCGDDLKFGALCITEPGGGSDVASICTTAKFEGDEYILNGSKCFITNGGIADIHVVFATVDKSQGKEGLRGFVVEKDTPGFYMGKKEKKMGLRTSHTAEVILDNCRVPKDNLLGEDKSAFPGLMKALDKSRPVIGAVAVGIARAAYEYALNYARERIQFGSPIAQNQAISFVLADMATEIDAARMLIWRAAFLHDRDLPMTKEASMGKVKASEVAVKVTEKAIQILGGYGYMKDYPVEKWYRDAKVTTLVEGTSEIQRMVISKRIIGKI